MGILGKFISLIQVNCKLSITTHLVVSFDADGTVKKTSDEWLRVESSRQSREILLSRPEHSGD